MTSLIQLCHFANGKDDTEQNIGQNDFSDSKSQNFQNARDEFRIVATPRVAISEKFLYQKTVFSGYVLGIVASSICGAIGVFTLRELVCFLFGSVFMFSVAISFRLRPRNPA